MKNFLLFLLLLASTAVWGQNYRFSFTSTTDAKFQVYLNGKLQNETPSGTVVAEHLDNKPYHVRIVVDDPYVIAYTHSLRPSEKRYEYEVFFNAVRERVYVRHARRQGSNTENEVVVLVQKPDSASITPVTPRSAAHVASRPGTVRKGLFSKKEAQLDAGTTTGNAIRSVKTKMVVEE